MNGIRDLCSGTLLGQSKGDHDTLSRSHKIMLYFVIVAPMLIYFGFFLLIYDGQLLKRRDEANIFMTLRLIQNGTSPDLVFWGTLQKGFVLLGLIISRISGKHLIEVSRIAAMLLGILATALVGLISQRLSGSYVAFIIAAALTASSQVFVKESTYFRANLPSLVLSLSSLYVLLRWNNSRSIVSNLMAGILYGISLQVKLLSVTMLPVYYFVMANESRWRVARRIFVFTLGIIAVYLLITLVHIGNDNLISMQLPLIIATPMSVRLIKLAGIFWNFFRKNSLLVYAWTTGITSLFISDKWDTLRGREYCFHTIWTFTTLAVLCFNYPTWNHHLIFLVPPLAVGTAWCFAFLISAEQDVWKKRSASIALVSILFFMSSYPLITLLPSVIHRTESLTSGRVQAVELLRGRLGPGSLIWSDDHAITLSGGFVTSPEMSEVSWKRIRSGLLTTNLLKTLLIRDKPGAIVISSGLFKAFPIFVDCLDAYLEKTVLDRLVRIYWTDEESLKRVSDCLDVGY